MSRKYVPLCPIVICDNLEMEREDDYWICPKCSFYISEELLEKCRKLKLPLTDDKEIKECLQAKQLYLDIIRCYNNVYKIKSGLFEPI